MLIGGMIYALSSLSKTKDKTEYSKIMRYFDDLKVSEFTLNLNNGELTYKLQGDAKDKERNYTVPNVSLFVNEVLGSEDGENYRRKYDEANPDAPLKYDLVPISDNSFWLNLIPTLLMLGVMIFFFVWMMMIDVIEIVCKPLRKLGGPYRIVGLAAIVAYIFFGGLCLWELWVNIYRFHFTTIHDIDGKKFLMAIWLSLVTIGCYGICITSAWGPKDLGRRQSS